MTVKIHDRADEFRIELNGRFSGDVVDDVASAWKDALADVTARRLTVDISRLTGYDAAGRKLLRDMCQHGTQIAAGNPVALSFLHEISAPERRGPVLVQKPSEPQPVPEEKLLSAFWRARAAGAK
ncbi:MAG: hypothetical protein JOY54_10680 [Acidobacteriaceae bacterium]|nr:hypothetical protein [Acidobacteriaceae bacterium]